jgi:aldehyde dehydrogenase (NAD+)
VSGGTIVCRNPADAREVVATYDAHEPADVAAICARAHSAQARWCALPGPRRGEQLARQIVAEEGKLFADATGEVERAAAVLHFHAGEAERFGGELADAVQAQTLAFTRRRALGVVGLITPWNFPIAIPAWKLAPALAAGNAVVIKPSSSAPGAVLGLVDVLREAGIPQDAVQVVLGGSEVGLALADDPHVRGLSFTGSTAVGRMLAQRVQRLGREVRFQGELGGNNPMVVLADADPEQAVALACEGAFAAAGQKCTATRRLIVERPVYEAVLAACARRARRPWRASSMRSRRRASRAPRCAAAASAPTASCATAASWCRRCSRMCDPGCACSTRRSSARSARCRARAISTRRSRSLTPGPMACRRRSARTTCTAR